MLLIVCLPCCVVAVISPVLRQTSVPTEAQQSVLTSVQQEMVSQRQQNIVASLSRQDSRLSVKSLIESIENATKQVKTGSGSKSSSVESLCEDDVRMEDESLTSKDQQHQPRIGPGMF